MKKEIYTLHIEDEAFAASEVFRVLNDFEQQSGGDFCFKNIIPSSGGSWRAVEKVEEAFDLIVEHWGEIDLILLDIKLKSDVAKSRVPDAGISLLLDIEKYANQKRLDKLPFKVIISSAFREYGQEVLQQSELIRNAVIGYTLKDPVKDTLMPALERFATIMLEREKSLLDSLRSIAPPRLVMPPREYDGWEERTTIVLRPEQILYVKGQQAWHHVYLTAAAQKIFRSLLKEEGRAQLLRNNPDYETLRIQLRDATRERKKMEPLGGEKFDELNEMVGQLKSRLDALKETVVGSTEIKATEYFRFAGSIGSFMKLSDTVGVANSFYRVTSNLVINLQYLARYNESRNEYTLVDDSVANELHSRTVPMASKEKP